MLRFAATMSVEDTMATVGKSSVKSMKKRRKADVESSSDEDDDDEHPIVEAKNKNNGAKLVEANLEDDDDEVDEDADLFADDAKKSRMDMAERNLEALVFGSTSSMIENMDKKKKKETTTTTIKKTKKSNKADASKESIADKLSERKPAWHDNDDETTVDLVKHGRLSASLLQSSGKSETVAKASELEDAFKTRFNKYFGTPMWADLDAKKKKQEKKRKLKSRADASGDDDEDDVEDSDDSDGDDEDDDYNDSSLFQRTGNHLAASSTSAAASRRRQTILPKSIIDIKVCTDANKEEPHEARLKSVEFHPSARVLLTAGINQKLTLFQIDGKKNAKIQSIFIDKFPILSARFTKQQGDQIIMGSRHKNFYYYDMHSGQIVTVVPPVKALDEWHRSSISANFEISPDNRLIAFVGSQGQIHLFSVKSKEWIDTLKINDACNAVAFSSDSRYLFAFGDEKVVNVFDMNDRGYRCLHKFSDYGCLGGTSLAVSPNSQFLATGCKSGVVNLYDLNDAMTTGRHSPKPLKSFMNLTTACTSLKFNCTSEILASCSSFSENACKLIHVSSLSVFSNFPLYKDNTSASASLSTKMRIPQCVDFSLNSGYFTIGNQKGNALLYRLKHYGSF